MSEDIQQEQYNAADEKQVNNARKKAAREKYNRLRVVEALMQNKETRQYLWELMESCYVMGEPQVPGDVYATYSNLGRQQVGKEIFADCLNFPTQYMTMAQENKNGIVRFKA